MQIVLGHDGRPLSAIISDSALRLDISGAVVVPPDADVCEGDDSVSDPCSFWRHGFMKQVLLRR